MSNAEILRKAKAELERRGWYQGEWMPDGADKATCPVCIEGAVNVAMNGDPTVATEDFPGPFQILRGVLGSYAYAWNDKPGRTVEEVFAAFDKAIALAEASETPKGGTP